MDERAEKKCMCGARRTGRLMTPLAERDQNHLDAALRRGTGIFGFGETGNTWTEVPTERPPLVTAAEALAKRPERNMLICRPDRTGNMLICWPDRTGSGRRRRSGSSPETGRSTWGNPGAAAPGPPACSGRSGGPT